jgi:hypothetical protein
MTPKPNYNMERFKVSKSAPVWLQNTAAVFCLLWGAKALLINVPGIDEAKRAIVGDWFDYIAGLTSVVFGIATLVTEKRRR